MHVEPHRTAEQLAELIRAERRAKVARRLDAVRLAMHGHAAAEVGERVLLSDRQVRAWVARYNDGGTDALADRPGRGRKGPLTAPDEERLKARLRAGPAPTDGGVCVLRGEDVVRIPAAEFGLVRSRSAVYDPLHRLGFEPRRPRPRHPKADPDAQDRFKKASRRGSRR